MINWFESMTQTFEFYRVNPRSWYDEEKLDCVTSCSITRDLDSQTLGSASLNTTENLGELYVRIYLVAIQNGETERVALGTYLFQPPSISYNGLITEITMDGYTPLIELGNPPPLGYTVIKDMPIMKSVGDICAENMRAPVVRTDGSGKTLYSNFTAETNENWLSFAQALMANDEYMMDLNEYGILSFAPIQETESMFPRLTYDDGENSIFYPDVKISKDIYGVPNVVEVVYSNGRITLNSRVVNDDPNSIVSTVNRGREIIHRDTSPNFAAEPTQEMVDEYARKLLKSLSMLDCTVSYKHGYTPARIGDCVRLQYRKAGLDNIRAKIKTQNISCEPGCPIEETAVFTTNLWG